MNEDSLKEAAENENMASPWDIYIDDRMVGFTMFAYDEEVVILRDRMVGNEIG